MRSGTKRSRPNSLLLRSAVVLASVGCVLPFGHVFAGSISVVTSNGALAHSVEAGELPQPTVDRPPALSSADQENDPIRSENPTQDDQIGQTSDGRIGGGATDSLDGEGEQAVPVDEPDTGTAAEPQSEQVGNGNDDLVGRDDPKASAPPAESATDGAEVAQPKPPADAPLPVASQTPSATDALETLLPCTLVEDAPSYEDGWLACSAGIDLLVEETVAIDGEPATVPVLRFADDDLLGKTIVLHYTDDADEPIEFGTVECTGSGQYELEAEQPAPTEETTWLISIR